MLVLGVALSLLSALAAHSASLLKHAGANESPAVDMRRPLGSGLDLWRSPRFAVGMLVGLVGWLLHTGAIVVAPLSVVQVILAASVVLLAVIADRAFGITVGPRQWAGLALIGVGLGVLVLITPRVGDARSAFEVAPLLRYELLLAALTVGCLWTARVGPPGLRGIAAAAGAGLCFGLCNVAVKATAGVLEADGTVLTPWVLVAVAGSVAGFYASARSLQLGQAIEVVAVTATAANVAGIVGGLAVFGDPLAGGAGLALQLGGLALVVLAAGLLPAPLAAVGPPAPA